MQWHGEGREHYAKYAAYKVVPSLTGGTASPWLRWCQCSSDTKVFVVHQSKPYVWSWSSSVCWKLKILKGEPYCCKVDESIQNCQWKVWGWVSSATEAQVHCTPWLHLLETNQQWTTHEIRLVCLIQLFCIFWRDLYMCKIASHEHYEVVRLYAKVQARRGSILNL